MIRSIAVSITLLAVLLVLTACGGADAEQSSSRCQSAPAVGNSIAVGLTVTGGGTLRGLEAVKSNDFNKVWFVAADIEGPGLDGKSDVGVWATNSLDGSGMIFAINAVAKEFSDLGDGSSTDANMTMSSDGAKVAASCVASALN